MHACNGISSQPKQRMSVSQATRIIFNSFLSSLKQIQSDSSGSCLKVAPAKCFWGRVTRSSVGNFARTSCGPWCFVLWIFSSLGSAICSWVVFWKTHLIFIKSVCLYLLGVFLSKESAEIPWYTASVFQDKSPHLMVFKSVSRTFIDEWIHLQWES